MKSSARLLLAILVLVTLLPAAPAGSRAYFSTRPAGSRLPSGAKCADLVRRSRWEPRPENYRPNHRTGYRINFIDGANGEGQRKLARRINGNFKGTTDEIIQWGACKWGFDENIVRAIAVVESNWYQSTVGDGGQSFGLLQIKCTVHEGTCPTVRRSTAFNVDYSLAWRRACFEGYFDWVPRRARGDEWGCIGLYYSGQWKTGTRSYVRSVKGHLANSTWLKTSF